MEMGVVSHSVTSSESAAVVALALGGPIWRLLEAAWSSLREQMVPWISENSEAATKSKTEPPRTPDAGADSRQSSYPVRPKAEGHTPHEDRVLSEGGVAVSAVAMTRQGPKHMSAVDSM